MILIGFALRRGTDWSVSFWDGLERLVYFVLFPSLLFISILRAPLRPAEHGPAVAIALCCMLAGILLAALARRILRPEPGQFAAGAQCAFRFNSYIGLALAQRVGGTEGLALCAIVIGFCAGPSNFGAVLPLARARGTRLAAELARNPLVIATLAGLIGNAFGFVAPGPLDETLRRLGSAAIALGLLSVGAGLHRNPGAHPGSDFASGWRLGLWLASTKLVVMPALALVAAHGLGLPSTTLMVVVMFNALPPSSSAYVLASRMGGDGPYVARLLSASTLASMLMIPFWLGMARWVSG